VSSPTFFPPRSHRRPHLGWILLAGIGCAGGLAQGPSPAPAAAPAVNWVLPLFTDQEGHRLMTLRGSEARPAGEKLTVKDLSVTTFSGTAEAQVETILLSPTAVFDPKTNIASGAATVRLIRDDIEVTGRGWTYDHRAKKVSLAADVRIVFAAQLNDILK
jgi:hypothetical protein